MEIKNYRENPKGGALKGSFDLCIPKWGGTMRRCRHFEQNGHQWISLPSEKYEAEGKTKYFQYWQFETDELKLAFEKRVLELLKKPQETNEIPF